jgi:4-hydroxy-tetrahydrodipicolinate synthase
MKKLYGVTTAMIMPFDEKGAIKIDTVKEHVAFLQKRGVHCLYPMGTTGEMLKMSTAERKAVAQAVVDAADGKSLVYIHVGAMRTEDAVELAVHAHRIGADGVGAVTPMFYGANEHELYAYYQAIATALPDDFPIYLYAIPQCACNDISPALAAKLYHDFPNIIGIKHSGPDFVKTYDYLAISEQFSVVQGNDRMFLPALSMGCDGVISGMASAYPELFVAVYDAFKAGELEKARKLQLLCNRVVCTLKSGASAAYMKEALRLRGLPEMYMRAPQAALTSAEKDALRTQLAALSADPLFASVIKA